MDWLHFGLERQPFRPAVDPDAYFASQSHEAALTAIAHGFARRDTLALIDGPSGIGKTLVVRKWIEDLLPEVHRVVIPNSRAERPTELLQAILFDLGKPYQGLSEQELRLAVTGHILDFATSGNYPTVLLLDEAQHLGVAALEELRLLGNLETRHGAAIFAVLVAQPALRETLRQADFEPFSQRLGNRVTIEPLSTEESQDYFNHQLRAAGGEPEKIASQEAVSLLAAAGRGIPRVLNQVAAMAMEIAASASMEQVDVEIALEAIQRLGLEQVESSESNLPILLEHPSRTMEPTHSKRKKILDAPVRPTAAQVRGPKDRATRKRSA